MTIVGLPDMTRCAAERTCGRCPERYGCLGGDRLGRPATQHTVTEVCDSIRLCRSVPAAAEKLGCSRGLIYKLLKINGLTAREVLK
jgi:hypothetical protein